MSKANGKKGDVVSARGADSWFYSDTVKEHFFNPRNFMKEDISAYDFDSVGRVGSPACGDMMEVGLKVTGDERITDFKWKTYGCGSAIASTSMLSEMCLENGGLTLEAARKIKPQDIMARLGGLPNRKFHCSVLCDKALRDAINDYYRQSDQVDKIIVEAARIVDNDLKVTDKDIEEAVLEGADTLEKVQQKTKVGTSNPACLPEVENLIRFYKEKYFG